MAANLPAKNRFQKLVEDISVLYLKARDAQVRFAWETGRRIVQEEQDGELRAEYGTGLLKKLSEVLSAKHGPGFSERTLQRMRSFYSLHPKISSTSTKLDWSDYVELMPVRDEKTRKQLEQRILKEGLRAKDIRNEVKRLRLEQEGVEDAPPVSAKTAPPLKSPSDLVLHTYSRSTLDVHLSENKIMIDCGFFVYWPVAKDVLKTLHITDTPSYTYAASLERVIDGDTLLALIEVGFGIVVRERLRLRGINCPEVSTPEGLRAKKYVEKLLPAASPLIIKSHKSKTDTYGRFVADVFFGPQAFESADGHNAILESPVYLNQHLLDEGMAELYQG